MLPPCRLAGDVPARLGAAVRYLRSHCPASTRGGTSNHVARRQDQTAVVSSASGVTARSPPCAFKLTNWS